ALWQAVGGALVAQRFDRLAGDADIFGDRLMGVPLVDGFDLAAGGQDGELAVGAGQDAVVPKLTAERDRFGDEIGVVRDAGGRPADVAAAVDDMVPDSLGGRIEVVSLQVWKARHCSSKESGVRSQESGDRREVGSGR